MYERLLKGESIESKDLPSTKYNPDITCFTQKAYNRLLQKFYIYRRSRNGKIINEEPTQRNIRLFETFMRNAEKRRLFYRDLSYEFAWQSQFGNSDFIRLITAFFQYMVDHNMLLTKGGTGVANVPWQELSAVILAPDGIPFGESLKTQEKDALNMPPNEEKHWKELVLQLVEH